MSRKIHGRYPGGPSRLDSPGEKSPVHIPTLEERRAGADDRRRRMRTASRRRHLIWTFAIVAVFAGLSGWVLGERTHSDPGELTRALESRGTEGLGMTHEVNRLMLELWKMEADERPPFR